MMPADCPPGSSQAGDDGRSGVKKIAIGICAMQRKATSKPMRAIMGKMVEFYGEWLEFSIFPEEVILNEPIDKWPLCDCLIGFHSTDFPLKKAIEYERLRRPYVINDMNRQFDLVFRTLARSGIDHPRHCVVLRNEKGDIVNGEVKEFSDHIEIDSMVFNKPFVEKPISAEDHNIYIYFPSSVGGGSQRLFRKVNNRSSWYSTTSSLRKEGSYIYEEFIPADGTDVKVYAVGPYYAHAEARKAPGLDGKVERDADGKEVRYPVILSAREKMIARRVVIAFGQTVCGFDLLRANGRSYVCDVNGFSFVKTSQRYYEDTAKILGNMILRRLASTLSIPWHIPFQDDDPPLVSTPSGKIMELRCVLAVIRHGDRTPKQKMKVVVDDKRFFTLFNKYGGADKKEIKMKRPTQLMEVLELTKQILNEQQQLKGEYMEQLSSTRNAQIDSAEFRDLEKRLEKCEDNVKVWDQMRTVLEMYGHFSGINRKVQLKYLKPKEGRVSPATNSGEKSTIGSISPHAAVEAAGRARLLLILKWGGELTTAGVLQAEALGKLFRTLYPGIRRADGKECPEDTQGLGFLRLHSTYRHDLKIYASDEGRVQMTAAAFARGLLALEGELTPILMQMVKSANTDGLLNDDYNARHFQDELKDYLHSILQADRDFTSEDYRSLNPSGLRSINNAMEFIRNPRRMCDEIASYVQKMCDIIRWHMLNSRSEKSQRVPYMANFRSQSGSPWTSAHLDKTLYLNETWELAARRWSKELREFRKVNKDAEGTVEYDISKIPDIYDNIKYDMEHNPDLCINNEGEFEHFYLCVKNMADIVVPQEYGVSEAQKIRVAQRVCTPLMSKIKNDLHRCIQNPDEGGESLTRLDPRASEGIATPMRHVRTRLYFTSESHIHTLMNLIRYGGLCPPEDKKWQRAMNFLSGVTEFNYMTQVVLMVYEDSRETNNQEGEAKDLTSRFHIELLFSPGLYPCFQTEKERIYENRFNNKHKTSPQQQSHGVGGKAAKSAKRKNLSGRSNLSASDTSDHDRESNNEQSDIDTVAASRRWTSGAGGAMNDSTHSSMMAEVVPQSRKGSLNFASRSLNDEEETPTESHATIGVEESSYGANNDSAAEAAEMAEERCSGGGDTTVGESVEEEDDEGLRAADTNDSEDDLAEHSVNLVVLGEVGASHRQYTSSELAKHSPTVSIRKRHPTYEKSHSTAGDEEGENADTQPADTAAVTAATDAFLEKIGIDEKKAIKADEFVKIVYKTPQPPHPHEMKAVHALPSMLPADSFDSSMSTTPTPAPLLKSMSETVCSLRRRTLVEMDAAESAESGDDGDDGISFKTASDADRLVGSPSEKPTTAAQLELDTNQATVGHEKGGWVRDLKEAKLEKDPSETSSISSGRHKASSTLALANLFIRSPGDPVPGVVEKGRSDQDIEEEDKTASRQVMAAIPGKGDISSVTIKDMDESSPVASGSTRNRSRFPYRFKHHTVNLLAKGTGVANRLISTDVLMGKFNDAAKRRQASNSVVLATAIIGRSSSAPRLQVYKAEDDISVTEIRRFWPPLRSLETMHDNIGFKQLDKFLDRMMTSSTPLPSPPKTPIRREGDAAAESNLDQRLKDTLKKLQSPEP